MPRTKRGLQAGFVFCREGRKHQRAYILKEEPMVKQIAASKPATVGEWLLAQRQLLVCVALRHLPGY